VTKGLTVMVHLSAMRELNASVPEKKNSDDPDSN